MAGGDHREHQLNKLPFGAFVCLALSTGTRQVIAEPSGVEMAVTAHGLIVAVSAVPPHQKFIVDVAYRRDLERLAIHIPPNDDVPELHFVAGKRASFIGEDVLDLSEFLVDADGSAGHFAIGHRTVHFLVDGHEVTLEDLDELQRHDQTDGDEGRVEDEVGAE